MPVSATNDSAILDAWIEVTAQSYPAETARHLLEDRDPFRNPVGHAMRETLPTLLDAILGRTPVDNAAAPLERLIRIRAVQHLTPGQAIGFLFQLNPLLRERVGKDQALEDRVNSLALMAFDVYMSCREQMHAIQLKELRRRAYVPQQGCGRELEA
jgi:hypothetical protein